MLGWLRKKLVNTSPLTLWSVSFSDGNIVTRDGQGAERKLPLCDLRRVVVATDDSGPWGADVVFLLYSDDLGSGPIDVGGAIWFRLRKETGMSDLFWLTDEQMERLRPFFPKSHGKPRVDDRRVLSGIVFVDRMGRRWCDAPSRIRPA